MLWRGESRDGRRNGCLRGGRGAGGRCAGGGGNGRRGDDAAGRKGRVRGVVMGGGEALSERR